MYSEMYEGHSRPRYHTFDKKKQGNVKISLHVIVIWRVIHERGEYFLMGAESQELYILITLEAWVF